MNRTASPLMRAMRHTIDVLGRIERRGCTVRAAHVNGGIPMVTIEPPPSGLFQTYGRRDDPPTCAVLLDGVRIEWPDHGRRINRS